MDERQMQSFDGDKLFFDLILSRAQECAGSGRFVDAERLLDLLPGDAPRALDLRARIYAQRGNPDAAKKNWSLALEKDPGNPHYQAALKRLGWGGRLNIWFYVCPALFLAALALGVAMLASSGKKQSATLQPTSLMVSEKKGGRGSDQPAVSEISLPPLRQQIAGLDKIAEKDALTCIFTDGLFSSGLNLKKNAKEQLTQLGRELEPFADRIRLQVIGCSDRVPLTWKSRFADNGALSLERALAVVQHLRRCTALPARIFELSSGSVEPAPHPGNPDKRDAKNRTVVIRVRPAVEKVKERLP